MGEQVGLLLRDARLRAGLTQTQLARLARTSQPTVSAYESGTKEPSGETLLRLLAAAGARLELGEAPASTRDYLRRAGSGAGTADEQLAAVMARVAEGQDAWYALREFLDAVGRVREVAGAAAVPRLVVSEPPSCGDTRWDAFAAALAEHLATTLAFERPEWATHRDRFLPAWWFPHRRRAFDAFALRESPAAFRRRGIFISSSMLERR